MKAGDFLDGPVPAKARVFVVSGPETFLRSEVIEKIIGKFEGASVDVVDVGVSGNAPPPPPNALLDDLMTRDLFGGARVMHVRDADAFVKAHGKVLGRFFAEGDAVHPVVFEGQGLLPKRSKGPPKTGFAGAVHKAGGVTVQCAELYDTPFGGGPPERSPLSTWVQRRAKRYGKTLSLVDAYHLHRAVGTALGTLDGELQKLALLVGDRPIVTLDDIERLVGQTRQAPIFELGESVAARDLAGALAQSERLFEQGYTEASGKSVRDPVSIGHTALRIVASKMQKVLMARELLDAGHPLAEAAAAVGTPPFARDRLRAQAEAWRDEGGRRCVLAGLLDLERALKTSGGAPRVLLDAFLLEGLRRPEGTTGGKERAWRR